MRRLQWVQTVAADRWGRIEHPRLYRAAPARKRDWIDVAFRWGIFAWLMWMIWAPVALGALIVLIIAL